MSDCDVLICGLGPVGQLLALLLGDLGVSTIAFDEAQRAVRPPARCRGRRRGPADLPGRRRRRGDPGRCAGHARRQLRHGARSHHARVQDRPTASSAIRRWCRSTSRRWSARWSRRSRTAVPSTCAGASGSRSSTAAADDVTAWVRPVEGGRAQPLRARYLVGCDGARSAVRARLQIPFGGSTFAQPWLVVDGLVDRPLAKVPHPHFVGDTARPAVTLPMSPGRHRWEWMLRPNERPEPFLEREPHPRADRPMAHRRARGDRAGRGLHVPCADARTAGGPAACCSRATPRT